MVMAVLPLKGAQVGFLVGEPRPNMPPGVAQKFKNKVIFFKNSITKIEILNPKVNIHILKKL